MGELVDLLVLVQTLILVGLERAGRPKQVPFVGLRLREIVVLQDGFDHTVVKPDEFDQHLAILNMVAL